MQNIVQITDVTLDELLDKIGKTFAERTSPKAVSFTPVMITVLNKKEASKTLNISESLFDKFQARGILPTTVIAGYNRQHKPINRWCQHHLLLIRPIILKLKYCQSEDQYLKTKEEIYSILGI